MELSNLIVKMLTYLLRLTPLCFIYFASWEMDLPLCFMVTCSSVIIGFRKKTNLDSNFCAIILLKET